MQRSSMVKSAMNDQKEIGAIISGRTCAAVLVWMARKDAVRHAFNARRCGDPRRSGDSAWRLAAVAALSAPIPAQATPKLLFKANNGLL